MTWQSLPSRERGLKYESVRQLCGTCDVAPFAGAWIEMQDGGCLEMLQTESLPSRERGLKYMDEAQIMGRISRSLRGSVD